MAKIDDCLECGQCRSRCPYGLDTPTLLKKNLQDYREILAGKPLWPARPAKWLPAKHQRPGIHMAENSIKNTQQFGCSAVCGIAPVRICTSECCNSLRQWKMVWERQSRKSILLGQSLYGWWKAAPENNGLMGNCNWVMGMKIRVGNSRLYYVWSTWLFQVIISLFALRYSLFNSF